MSKHNFKKGQKFIFIGSENSYVKVGSIYTIKRVRNSDDDDDDDIELEETHMIYTPSFFADNFKSSNSMSLKQAIQAMLDGHKIRSPRYSKEHYKYFDGSYFRHSDGDFQNIANLTDSNDWEIYQEPEMNYSVTLANGTKLNLSKESYEEMAKHAK